MKNPRINLQAPFEKVLRENRIHDAAKLVRDREQLSEREQKAKAKAERRKKREEKAAEKDRAERLRTMKRPKGYNDEKDMFGNRRPPKEKPSEFVSPEEIAARFDALAQRRQRAKAANKVMQIIPDDPPTLEELEKKYEQVIMIEIGGGIFENKEVEFYHSGDLTEAVRYGDVAKTKKLLDIGLDGTTLDAEDGTPLFLKCFLKQLAVDAKEIKAPKISREENGSFVRVEADYAKTAELLLKAKNNPEDINRLEEPGVAKGWTALHYAVDKGSVERVMWLLNHEANIDQQSDTGISPLMLAARHGNLKVLLFLLEAEAEMELQDNKGRTALHEAARISSLDAVEVLLKAGAIKDSVDDDDKRPADLAMKRGWKKMTQ